MAALDHNLSSSQLFLGFTRLKIRRLFCTKARFGCIEDTKHVTISFQRVHWLQNNAIYVHVF